MTFNRIGNEAFKGCTSLTKITIPASVTQIGNEPFTSCHNLKLIVIDALDGEDYERMVNLIPRESRHLAKPSWGLKAKEQVIESLKPIGIDLFPKKLPESVISLIQQMEGRLNDELEKSSCSSAT